MGDPVGFIFFYSLVGMFAIVASVFFGLISAGNTLFFVTLSFGFSIAILTILSVSAEGHSSSRRRSFERRYVFEARPRRRYDD